MEEPFRDELRKDEKILWTGGPDPKVLFTVADLFFLPFGLIWTGMLVWMLSGIVSGPGGNSSSAPPPLWFFIPFMAAGFWILIGRFMYKVWKKKRTHYAVTDKRILIVTRSFGKHVRTAYLNTIPGITRSIGAKGIGTVRFGNSSLWSSVYANTGMEMFGAFYGEDAPTFYDIRDAEKVYKLVTELISDQGDRSTGGSEW